MIKLFQFRWKYFIYAVLLFITEVLIAAYLPSGGITRDYVGDVLVVILIYCAVRTFFEFDVILLSLAVLLFAYILETLQYFNLVKHLGLADSKLANIVIGNSFSWIDIISYTLGIMVILIAERWAETNPKNTSVPLFL